VTKRLVDIDEQALDAARAGLGTHTIKDTVNEALRRAAENRRAAVKRSLDVLAHADLVERDQAWR
jgi:Arc/MetJ family transcription regulator